MSNCLFDQESKLFHVNSFEKEIMNICLSPDGTFGLICRVHQHYSTKICLRTGEKSIFTNQSGPNNDGLFSTLCHPERMTFSPDGKFVLVWEAQSVLELICLSTGNVSTISTKDLDRFGGNLIFSHDGKFIFVILAFNVMRICVKSGTMSTFAGVPWKRGFQNGGFRNGPKEQAMFGLFLYLTLSPDGTYLLVCDGRNQCIRKICLLSGQVSTFAGMPKVRGSKNGPKKQATFNCPKSLTFSPDGTYLLVCDTDNCCIRKICLLSGQVSTFAGIPEVRGRRNGPKEQATFMYPDEITFSKNGKFIIIQYLNNCRYMKIKN